MAGFKPGQKRDNKGRWTKSGAGLAAATVVGVVLFGGAGGGAGVSSVESAAGQGMRAKMSSKDAAKKGQRERRGKGRGSSVSSRRPRRSWFVVRIRSGRFRNSSCARLAVHLTA